VAICTGHFRELLLTYFVHEINSLAPTHNTQLGAQWWPFCARLLCACRVQKTESETETVKFYCNRPTGEQTFRLYRVRQKVQRRNKHRRRLRFAGIRANFPSLSVTSTHHPSALSFRPSILFRVFRCIWSKSNQIPVNLERIRRHTSVVVCTRKAEKVGLYRDDYHKV